MTSNDGFSVVAPMKVTSPCSTNGRNASCWPLLNRCTSSTNRIVWRPDCARIASARATASRMSLTPDSTADSAMNSALKASAIRRAMVVLPTPGGPHRIIECGLPAAKATASGLPGARRCRCPITSAIVFGRSRSASGAAGLAGVKRSVMIRGGIRLSGISGTITHPRSPRRCNHRVRHDPRQSGQTHARRRRHRFRRDDLRMLLAGPAADLQERRRRLCALRHGAHGTRIRDAEEPVRAVSRPRYRADGPRAARRVRLHRPGARRGRVRRDGADGRHGRRGAAHRILHALSPGRAPRRGVRLCARRFCRAATSWPRWPRCTSARW